MTGLHLLKALEDIPYYQFAQFVFIDAFVLPCSAANFTVA